MQNLLTPREAAAILKVSRGAIYHYMANGLLPYIQISGVRRIRERDLNDMLEANVVNGRAA